MPKILKNILAYDVNSETEPIIGFLNKYDLKWLVVIYSFIKLELIGGSILLLLVALANLFV